MIKWWASIRSMNTCIDYYAWSKALPRANKAESWKRNWARKGVDDYDWLAWFSREEYQAVLYRVVHWPFSMIIHLLSAELSVITSDGRIPTDSTGETRLKIMFGRVSFCRRQHHSIWDYPYMPCVATLSELIFFTTPSACMFSKLVCEKSSFQTIQFTTPYLWYFF